MVSFSQVQLVMFHVFSGAGDVSTEAEVRRKRRRKHAVITRRFVPLSGQKPGTVEFGKHERSREMLTLTMAMMNSIGVTSGLVP